MSAPQEPQRSADSTVVAFPTKPIVLPGAKIHVI